MCVSVLVAEIRPPGDIRVPISIKRVVKWERIHFTAYCVATREVFRKVKIF